MSTPSPILVFVDREPDQILAEQMLLPYRVKFFQGGTSSGAISYAIGSLWEHPERPIAVLTNADVDNPRTVAEYRGSMRRMLAQAHWENWYGAMAAPNLFAWIRTDPHYRQELDALEATRKVFNADRAARVKEIARAHAFDPGELLRAEPDYRGLVDFLTRHGAAKADAARSAAV